MRELFDLLSLPKWSGNQEGGRVPMDRESLESDALKGRYGAIGHMLRQQGEADRSDILDLLEYYEAKGQNLAEAFRKGWSTNEVLAMARGGYAENGMVSWQKILADGICLNIDNLGCGIGQPVKLTLNLQKENFAAAKSVRRFFLDPAGGGGALIIETLGEALCPPPGISFAGQVSLGGSAAMWLVFLAIMETHNAHISSLYCLCTGMHAS